MSFPAAIMIFAAGRGTRMGRTDVPKPLVEVAGRPLIDHALDLADAAGVPRRVANTHHLPDALEARLAARGVVVVREPELLDTGGGLVNARPALGPGPVLTLNADAAWRGPDPIAALRRAWKGEGGLLLLVPQGAARGRVAPGDFAIGPGGRLAPDGPFVYTGLQVLGADAVEDLPEGGAFSMWTIWKRLLARGALRGVIWDGAWCDVGTPAGIAAAEEMLGRG